MTNTFTVTAEAAARIIELQAMPDYSGTVAFRVAIQGGGCSGFQYEFSFIPKIEADDHVLEVHGSKVVIDPISMQYLNGASLVYENDLGGNRLLVLNPNATSKCGCGSSFSV